MATPKSKKTEEGKGFQVIPFPSLEEDVPTIYVNHMQVLPTPWDFTLRLGEVITGETARVREKLRVQLSPTFAKAAMKLLTLQVAAYEERMGRISELGTEVGIEKPEA